MPSLLSIVAGCLYPITDHSTVPQLAPVLVPRQLLIALCLCFSIPLSVVGQAIPNRAETFAQSAFYLTGGPHEQSQRDTLTFETFPVGSIVTEITGAGPAYPVAISGANDECRPNLDAAIIFDSSNPSEEDVDLGTPNEDFGGPGIDADGSPDVGGNRGSAFENSVPLGNVLIVHANCGELEEANNSGGRIEVPDDASRSSSIRILFPVPVTMYSYTSIDNESTTSGVRLLGENDEVLAEFITPRAADNGVVQVLTDVLEVGSGVAGVSSIEFMHAESHAIDNIIFAAESAPVAAMDVRKAVGDISSNGDGTFVIPYAISLANVGETDLLELALEDTIRFGTFAPEGVDSPGQYKLVSQPSIEDPSGSNYQVNSGYNGADVTNLLLGGTSGRLMPGESIHVRYDVLVFPLSTDSLSTTLVNSVSGRGKGDDGGGDSDDSDETEIEIDNEPSISIVKSADAIQPSDNGLYSIPYRITIVNDGLRVLNGIQVSDTVSFAVYSPDDLSQPGTYTIQSGPEIVAGRQFGFVANADYNGSTNTRLLDELAGGTLFPGQSLEIDFVVKLNPDADDSMVSNRASGVGGFFYGEELEGRVRDFTDDVESMLPASGGRQIEVSKSVSHRIDDTSGRVELQFDIVVVNTGDLPLYDVILNDTLFSGYELVDGGTLRPGTYDIIEPILVSNTGPDSFLPNTNYEGKENVNLLDIPGSGTLYPGDTLTAFVGVYVFPRPEQEVLSNTASVSGDDVDDDDDDFKEGTGDSTDSDTVEIPIEARQPSVLSISKRVDRKTSEPGEQIVFRIRVENGPQSDTLGVVLIDESPPELIPVKGSAKLYRFGDDRIPGTSDDLLVEWSYQATDKMMFAPIDLEAGEIVELSYVVRVSSTAPPGTYVNMVRLEGDGEGIVADASVEVRGDPIFMRSTVLGKVFFDANRNGYQDDGEIGIPGAQVLTAEGLISETDEYGRYHLADLDGGDLNRGRNLVMKVNRRSLPVGAEFTTAHPRVMRITQGMLHQIDFGIYVPPLAGPETQNIWDYFVQVPADSILLQADFYASTLADSLRDQLRASYPLQLLFQASSVNPRPSYIPVPFNVHIEAEVDGTTVSVESNASIFFETWSSSIKVGDDSLIVADALSLLGASSVGDVAVNSIDVSPILALLVHVPTASIYSTESTLLDTRARAVSEVLHVAFDRVAEPDQSQSDLDDANRRLDEAWLQLRDGYPQLRYLAQPLPGQADQNRGPDCSADAGPEIARLIACRPDQARLWLIDDPVPAKPVLNVGTPPRLASETDTATFYIYSNYVGLIDHFDLVIYDSADSSRSVAIDTVAVSRDEFAGQIHWHIPDSLRQRDSGRRSFGYKLFASDQAGSTDETVLQGFRLSSRSPDLREAPGEFYRRVVYGNNSLIRQEIEVEGNRIRIVGDIGEAQDTYVTNAGIVVPVRRVHTDAGHSSTFVLEFIAPATRVMNRLAVEPGESPRGRDVPFQFGFSRELSYQGTEADLIDRDAALVDSLGMRLRNTLLYEPTVDVAITSYVKPRNSLFDTLDTKSYEIVVEFESGKARLDRAADSTINSIPSLWGDIVSIRAAGHADRDRVLPGTTIDGNLITNNVELGMVRATTVLDALESSIRSSGLNAVRPRNIIAESRGDSLAYRKCDWDQPDNGYSFADCKRVNRRVTVTVSGVLKEKIDVLENDSLRALMAMENVYNRLRDHAPGALSRNDIDFSIVDTTDIGLTNRVDLHLDAMYTVFGQPDSLTELPTESVTSRDCDDYVFGVLSADFETGSSSDSRVQGFMQGKVACSCRVTGRLDLTDADLNDLFTLRSRDNPQSIFRNLDPDRYYTGYGDGSTTVESAPTLSPVYASVRCNQVDAVLGNYNVGFTGTELAQYNRSLFGGRGKYQSRNLTRFNENRYLVSGFVSNPETALGHESLRATGGSVYYLERTNIVVGTTKIRIEVRDRDTDRIVQNIALKVDQDYEVDEIHGRIILQRPLHQVVGRIEPSLVNDEPLDGDPVFILVDYEYFPVGISSHDMTAGVRARAWPVDQLGAGVTAVKEYRDGIDYTLAATDLTIMAAPGSYISFEYAETEATQSANSTRSLNGGLTFDTLATSNLRSGSAVAIEGQINFRDFTGVSAVGGVWWRNLESGYSTARLDAQNDVTATGANFRWDDDGSFAVSAAASSVETENIDRRERLAVQVDYEFGRYDVASEVQYQSREQLTVGPGKAEGVPAIADAYLAAARFGVDVHPRHNIYAIAQTSFNESAAYREND
ncbi:MAG: DUF11 domain-containing protein, partial [Rhodothermales bacterium]|nr:DUF11 domain-containing protein [Rhodothermales bacterium]